MKIIVIDPRLELIIRSVHVYDRESARHCEKVIKQDEIERGQLDRLLVAGGTVRIMEPGDRIPEPLAAGKVIR